MAEHRSHCCRSFLRGTLRALNYLLAIIGVLMMAYAMFMYEEWKEASSSPAPPAPPDMPPLQLFEPSFVSAAPETFHDENHDNGKFVSNPMSRKVLVAGSHHPFQSLKSIDGEDSSSALAKYPWFIYLFGGAGAFVFLTASVGILSADFAGCGITCFLGLYHTLMVLLLLLQVAVICFYFFDKSWEHDLPPDSTGEYNKLRKIVLDNLVTCQIAGLITLGLQLLALLVSCSVYYAESWPRLEYRVLQQYDSETGSQASYGEHRSSRVTPGGSALGPHARGGAAHGDAWSRRMHDKYGAGAESSAPSFGYDPEQGRALARGDDDVAESRGRCSVM